MQLNLFFEKQYLPRFQGGDYCRKQQKSVIRAIQRTVCVKNVHKANNCDRVIKV
jgi:hypothetical protein